MSTLAEAATKIVEVLTEFNSEERLRIVKASLTLLGDELKTSAPKAHGGEPQSVKTGGDIDEHEDHGVHALASHWMRKSQVSLEQLEHYFHFDQGKVISIALPGSASSKKDKTINAYLTQGLASFLATGDPSFSDADARKFCEQSGCYDSPHHSDNVKALKNRVSGSKATGWKLTTPGLSAAADLIRNSKS